MFVADVKCPQAMWQTVPSSRAGIAKASVSKAVVCYQFNVLADVVVLVMCFCDV